jgi:hypothetical protein|tara:strand:- start:199 stop:465 length:267 start_codon:yes stop_codon:yes gene_type:complete
MEEYSIIENMITNVGFPIAVAVFVLYKLNNSLDKLRNSVDKLYDLMSEKDLTMKELVLKVDYLERSIHRKQYNGHYKENGKIKGKTPY